MNRDNAIENTTAKNYIESSQLPLEESRNNTRIDYLLRQGLIKDTSKIQFYRRVLQDPKAAVQNQVTRPMVAEILNTFLDLAFNDSVIWNRIKTIITRRHKQSISSLKEDISDEGLYALMKKSNEHEVPLETIFEVYNRGAEGKTEQEGFNRVNSFLAGGKARQLDADLLGETVIQPAPEKAPTLAIVKRVLKESKGKR
jgi:hypothetical protein